MKRSGGRLNIKMPSYQYRYCHVKDNTVSPTVLCLTWKSPYLGKSVFILRKGPERLLIALLFNNMYFLPYLPPIIVAKSSEIIYVSVDWQLQPQHLFQTTTKKASKLGITLTGGFSSQRTSNAERVSIS